MKKLKQEKGVSVILILIIVVILLGVIMGIKIFTSNNKQESDFESYSSKMKDSDYNEFVKSFNTNNEVECYPPIPSSNYMNSSRTNISANIRSAYTTSVGGSIILFIISLVINVGIAKLYKKLNMPDWTSKFMIIYPFATILSNFIPSIKNIIMLVAGIMAIVSLGKYFKAVGMKEIWAGLPLIGVVLMIIGSILRFVSGIFISTLLQIVGICSLIAFIIIYIVANIALGNMFNKGTGFKVGLALLPVVFQAILGYKKDETLSGI